MNVRDQYRNYMMTGFVDAVEPIVVDHGDGAELIDDQGKRYLDCFAGIAVSNCGHGNPAVTGAIVAQVQKLLHCGAYIYHSAPTGALAERLAHLAPANLTRTFFGNSGAEANETALRLAKRYSGRHEWIALQGSFHGRSYATLSLSGLSRRKHGGGPYMAGVAFAPVPYCYRCPLGLKPESCGLRCADAVEDTIRCETSDDVAAFIAEPIMGEGGIIIPPPGYFTRVAAILRDHGILFIADEVQCGYGRSGTMFACEQMGVAPDLLTLGKGIANGLPLSACMSRDEIAAAFKPGDHLSTFGGNPVACAAGLVVADFMEEASLPARAMARGRFLMERLASLQRDCPAIGEVRGMGLMVGIELIADAKRTPDAKRAAAVRAQCREQGILIGTGGIHGNVLRLQPPLVISEEQLARTVEVLGRILRQP